MKWLIFLLLTAKASALDLKAQTGLVDNKSVLTQHPEYQRLVSESSRIKQDLARLQRQVRYTFGRKA